MRFNYKCLYLNNESKYKNKKHNISKIRELFFQYYKNITHE